MVSYRIGGIGTSYFLLGIIGQNHDIFIVQLLYKKRENGFFIRHKIEKVPTKLTSYLFWSTLQREKGCKLQT